MLTVSGQLAIRFANGGQPCKRGLVQVTLQPLLASDEWRNNDRHREFQSFRTDSAFDPLDRAHGLRPEAAGEHGGLARPLVFAVDG